jgi:hypothetical protein
VEGDQVVVSWGEIDPHLGNQPIMVGFPTDANQEDLWLVVPSDSGCGRYVSGVANISVRTAPPPGNNWYRQ